jgi:hypothetical protein
MLRNITDIISLLIITFVIYFVANVLINVFSAIVWIVVGIAMYYLTQNPITVNGLVTDYINHKFSGVFDTATKYVENFRIKAD